MQVSRRWVDLRSAVEILTRAVSRHIALCLVLVAGSASAELPESVSSMLARHKIPARAVSAVVRDVEDSVALVNYRGDVPRNPASVIKILTTYAALELLGPGFVWPTEAYLDGELSDGRLDGNLTLKGYGDPYFVTEAFWRLIRGLRDRGLVSIRGDLVVDNTYFARPTADPGDFDGRPHRVYNAQPDALSLNFQSTRFNMVPEPNQGIVRVFLEPPLANFTVDNKLRLTDGPCSWRHYYPKTSIAPIGEGAQIVLEGDYSVRCREGTLNRLVTTPPEHLFGAFVRLWADGGGTFSGSMRVGARGAGSKLFHRVESRPLGDSVRGMNKFSNNLMTRQLFLSIGADSHGAPGTREKSRAAIKEWLARTGIEARELVLDNGAGLSRSTRISAVSLERLLRRAYESAVMPEFASSLAIAGVDGTLYRRFKDSPLRGRAHLKTGSLNHVSGIAGYVLSQSGRRFAVVMLINHKNVHQGSGKAVQDALLNWVYRH